MYPPNLDNQNSVFETGVSLAPSLQGLFALSWEGLIFTDRLGICHHINNSAGIMLGLDSAAPPQSYNLHQFLGVTQDPAWHTWQQSHDPSVVEGNSPAYFRGTTTLTRTNGQTADLTYGVTAQANGFLWILPPSQLIQWQEATGESDSPDKLTPASYQAILETQTEMVVRFLPDSTFTYVNPAYCQMIGKPAAELLGRHFLEVIPPDAQAMMREELWAMNTLTPKHPFRVVINPSIGHDGSQIWHEWTNIALFDSNDTLIEFQATGRDITADYNFTRTLKAAKDRLQLALEIAEIGYCDWDLRSNRLVWSDGYEQLMGLAPGTFDQRIETFMGLVHPEDRARVQTVIDDIIQSHQQRTVEFRIIRPSGEIRWFLARGTAIYDDHGHPVRFTGVDMDITAQKLREQELQYQRDLRELLFNESTDAMFLVDPNTVQIVDCNPRAVELFEADKKSNLIGLAGHTLHVRPFTAAEVEANVTQMHSQGFWTMEIEYQTLKGNRFWGNIAAKPVTIAGHPHSFVRVSDISPWKQVTLASELSELRFRAIFDQAELGIAICSAPDFRIDQSNPCLQNLLGYTAEKLKCLGFAHITHPDDLGLEQPFINECLAGTRDHYQLEKRCLTKTGEIRWVSVYHTAVRDATGQIQFAFVFFKDISNRKQAELALQASEGRFRALFEQAVFGIVYGELSGEFVSVNQAFTAITGYTQVELQNHSFRTITYPPDLEREQPLVQALMAGEIHSYTLEKRYIRKDGSLVWVSVTINKIFDDAGQVIGGMGIIQDISQSKVLELELEAARLKYQTLFAVMPVGIMITDEQGHIIEANPASKHILDLDLEEQQRWVLEDNQWLCYRSDGSLIPSQDSPAVIALRENRVIQGFEMGYQRPDGELIWLDVTAAPIPIPGLGVVLTYMDVTERKRTSQALRDKETSLRLALEASNQGFYDLDIVTGEAQTDFGYDEMLGYAPGELVHSLDSWQASLHPEDRDPTLKTLQDYLSGQLDHYRVEFRIQTKAGDWKWVLSTGKIVAWDAEGQPTRMLGTHIDIDQRKDAELALAKQAAQERVFVEITNDIRRSLDLHLILDSAVENIRDLLRADRVLVLRILPNYHAETLAESLEAGLTSLHNRCWLNFELPGMCWSDYLMGDYRLVDRGHQSRCDTCWIPNLTDDDIQAKIIAPINQARGGNSYLWGLLIVQSQAPISSWTDDDGRLIARICQQLAIAIQQAELYESLQAANSELQAANQELEYLARYDGLTQVANRRHFDEYLNQEWGRMNREQQPLAVIICDIDFFKAYNDHYGHIAGDSCLQKVALALQKTVNRAGDLVARYGGEEFALILPNTNLAGALAVADRIQLGIRQLNLPHHHSAIAQTVTLSLGITAHIPDPDSSLQALVAQADHALYAAKQTGRNRYCYWDRTLPRSWNGDL
ncbi:PAS domain S-box protein [Thermosynechococcaceae cyanobacterium BACA0444]|uniref:PAS domain S-box protein n=1 Tax=Pseudocalidococcus azoricus BACA0444 TaxID=2918990 RepID=A0AAE4FSW2_9CYAN|nr:PAS domain S-box protein [Pseudocalidococcus azoricus]MDS3861511.1 PAS domain S-box protein [Pseudocalidococcus azoricus BACA0444]